jgi:two-component system LytT family sensor kinase
MKPALIPNRRLPVILHVLAWVIILFLPTYLMRNFGGGDNRFLQHFYMNTAIYGTLFYLNYLWLVPYYFFGSPKWRYFLPAALAVAVVCFLMWLINDYMIFDRESFLRMQRVMEEMDRGREVMKPPIRQMRMFNYISTSILVTGFSLGLGVLDRLRQNEKERKELEKEKLNSELAFLKNQISPHLFFNTLNNIYSLIGSNQDEARETVHKLSKLMRYLLYESEHETSKLSEEIAFMNNYIDLMKLRLNEKVALTVSFPDEIPELEVPPLLFIPIIENAFKHGISSREASYIDLEMRVEGTKIFFHAKNSIRKGIPGTEGEYSGIGLENVRKRLNLLFPGSHRLEIRQERDDFILEIFLETEKIKS